MYTDDPKTKGPTDLLHAWQLNELGLIKAQLIKLRRFEGARALLRGYLFSAQRTLSFEQ